MISRYQGQIRMHHPPAHPSAHHIVRYAVRYIVRKYRAMASCDNYVVRCIVRYGNLVLSVKYPFNQLRIVSPQGAKKRYRLDFPSQEYVPSTLSFFWFHFGHFFILVLVTSWPRVFSLFAAMLPAAVSLWIRGEGGAPRG